MNCHALQKALPQSCQQHTDAVEKFFAVSLQRHRHIGLGASIAIQHFVPLRLIGLLYALPLQMQHMRACEAMLQGYRDQYMVPVEFFALVMLVQATANIPALANIDRRLSRLGIFTHQKVNTYLLGLQHPKELLYEFSRHFNQLNNPRC